MASVLLSKRLVALRTSFSEYFYLNLSANSVKEDVYA